MLSPGDVAIFAFCVDNEIAKSEEMLMNVLSIAIGVYIFHENM